MRVFNSLGSNYSFSFALKSIFSLGSKQTEGQFVRALSEHYGGKATLTYKGREALELALKNLKLGEGASVGINGFTCYVVYKAVVRAGCKPVFIDVAEKQMDFGVKELKKVVKDHPLKAVVIQNTLGYPVDIKELKGFCDKNKIAIVEDLAHSLGAVYETGQEAGTVGSATMTSFSQDKPLDVVAGGALVDRQEAASPKLLRVSWSTRQINRYYPFWTAMIRSTYGAKLGLILHRILKTFGLLANPMHDAGPGIHEMSKSAASQALLKWNDRSSEVAHRQKIAKIYEESIPKTLQLPSKIYGKPTYLRFPLYVKDQQSLVKSLRQSNVYISDIWYDAPISPKRYLTDTDYQDGECPRAEDLAKHIVNLPTHRHVSESTAKLIAERVTSWLQSQ